VDDRYNPDHSPAHSPDHDASEPPAVSFPRRQQLVQSIALSDGIAAGGFVTPAQAGIKSVIKGLLDARIRGHDRKLYRLTARCVRENPTLKNGGSFSDILFQNKDTGQVSIWEMEGNTRIGGGLVSADPGLSWHAIGASGSDILFQNTSGQTSIWEMDGSTRIGGGPISTNAGTSWRAVGLT
jgi:hypothetical protein